MQDKDNLLTRIETAEFIVAKRTGAVIPNRVYFPYNAATAAG